MAGTTIWMFLAAAVRRNRRLAEAVAVAVVVSWVAVAVLFVLVGLCGGVAGALSVMLPSGASAAEIHQENVTAGVDPTVFVRDMALLKAPALPCVLWAVCHGEHALLSDLLRVHRIDAGDLTCALIAAAKVNEFDAASVLLDAGAAADKPCMVPGFYAKLAVDPMNPARPLDMMERNVEDARADEDEETALAWETMLTNKGLWGAHGRTCASLVATK